MATKPETYPQKIQRLTEQLAEKDQRLAAQMETLALIPELQAKVEQLESLLQATAKTESQAVGNDKAKLTDAIQRAESAEQGLRNSQAALKGSAQQVLLLESQLELLGKEHDKNQQLQNKNDFLTAELQSLNTRSLNREQQLVDKVRELEAENASAMNALMLTRRDRERIVGEFNELTSAIKSAPDILTQLKERVG